MIASFEHHKADLERIVRMLREDKVVRNGYYRSTDPGDLVAAGIKESRTNEYRRLCEAAGCRDGFVYDPETGRALFPVGGTGLAIGGATKSIEYDATPPTPLAANLDSLPSYSREGFIVYRHIEGSWYLSYNAN